MINDCRSQNLLMKYISVPGYVQNNHPIHLRCIRYCRQLRHSRLLDVLGPRVPDPQGWPLLRHENPLKGKIMQPSSGCPASHLRLQVLKHVLRWLPHDRDPAVIPPINMYQQGNIPNSPKRTRHALQYPNAWLDNAVKVRLVRLPQITAPITATITTTINIRIQLSWNIHSFNGCGCRSWSLLSSEKKETTIKKIPHIWSNSGLGKVQSTVMNFLWYICHTFY